MWYLYFSVLVFNSVALLTKKKLEPIVYYASIFWGLFFAEFTDRWTDKWDFYGFFEPYVIDWPSTVIILGIYPAATVLLINWYPYKGTSIAKIRYVLAWSIFSSAFEYSFYLAGYEYFHGGWEWWYSAISYPFLYEILFLQVWFVRRLIKKGESK
ncbi:hypothetical protein AN964_01890 [Heyndrickxia shackletonii]|uniref:Lycopene cyclase domain-containing protein n=1 Tax=Heyndrickxia shackletonii TaxID=157838 RepID=A0A0Q3WUX0_9BACI|nr:hypothetical protein [Heyndrickxia shackletonii]KQL52413.1 hypothetical protein AN964_01890 [Heyndrickxia shackletonii]MBB2479192.1 hypothetical protein [Bacillus sp. APMAM]